MPLYSFATYVDTREYWAIRADNLDHAYELIGDDPDGNCLNNAVRFYTEAVECRSEFVTDLYDMVLVEEITPDHWAWGDAHRETIERSLRQNIAAIAAELHTHRLYEPFYDKLGERINGFTGIYDLCISMAEALTEWEIANGLLEAYENTGIDWIELVEDFAGIVLDTAIQSGEVPDPAQILPTIPALKSAAAS